MMICKHATPVSELVNVCGIGKYGGRPSKGVCRYCIERGENSIEFIHSTPKDPSPSLFEKGVNLAESLKGWAAKGFAVVTPEQLEDRQAICQECPEWNPAGFSGTGSCNKCGCSTQAKLRMSTSKCPIDKWGPVDVRQTD